MYKMFSNQSRFTAKERTMNRYEFLQGISYYKEKNVETNKSNNTELVSLLPKAPSGEEKKKLLEALEIMETRASEASVEANPQ